MFAIPAKILMASVLHLQLAFGSLKRLAKGLKCSPILLASLCHKAGDCIAPNVFVADAILLSLAQGSSCDNGTVDAVGLVVFREDRGR